MPNSVLRYRSDPNIGLSDQEVVLRKNEGLANDDVSLPTKTVSKIIKDNLFTLFNLINFFLAAAIIYVGSFKNLLFMGVVIANLIISTYQEIRAKKTVDKLSILSLAKVNVIRNGLLQKVNINDLVLDDIIKLTQGNQIPTDCKIICGECEVNESLLTGESNSIYKKEGSLLLSGSHIISGQCKARVEHVGKYNYASKISSGAKYVKKTNSQIMLAFNKIILILSILIIPIGIFLFAHQLKQNIFENAVINTTAALIGMIPEGLMLLVSTVLAVSVIRLSKYKVLVQELYCIETLARVDTLCIDKTGTITEGTMQVEDIVAYKENSKESVAQGLAIIVNNTNDTNPTYFAVKNFVDDNNNIKEEKASQIIPFSSEKKWSGAYIDGLGSYIMGAAEFVLGKGVDFIKENLEQYAKKYRVLVLAHSENKFSDNKTLPEDLKLIGFVLINDVIRENAKKTLKYFYDQGVDIKIISGDNVLTVSNIAKRVGLKNYEKCIDAKMLKTKDDIKKAVKEFSIFARVSPMQKKDIICALKEQGHTVAMTGDGVNDVLALKEADCSVVMANGSDAARNVSQLVLLNSDFSSMPKVVLEGRRSINNIQRSSSLFLVKTIYSTLLAVLFLFLNSPYPFMPIQMTLTSVLTIGIPSFILALEPNKNRINGNLFKNIVSRALPCALTIVISILIIMGLSHFINLSDKELSTLCVILTGFSGLFLLFKLCIPFNKIRKFLFSLMSSIFLICILFFKDFFSLSELNVKLIIVLIFLCFFASFLFKNLSKIIFKIKK